MPIISRCWCGSERLEPFSEEYLRCPNCESLVLIEWPDQLAPKSGEELAYYGKEYWLSHQEHDLQLPTIFTRARSDLVDRVPYWLEKILAHRLPPGQALELGCANGSLVAVLRQAGFDAAGLELSPWVVEFARQTFDVPMYQGPVEEQAISPHSLDLLILMDVIEHLPEPLETLRKALMTLRPGGLVIMQTPAYPAGKSFAELSANNDPFLKMLIPGDHLHLFSHKSLKQLCDACGLTFTLNEPALFPYDQFVFAGSAPIPSYTGAEIAAKLEEKAGSRLALAQIELFQRLARVESLFQQADQDRSLRLESLHTLEKQLAEAEADRTTRLEHMNELTRQLVTAEADRAARLEVIHALELRLKNIAAEKDLLTQRIEEYRYALAQAQRRFSLWNFVTGKKAVLPDLQVRQIESSASAQPPGLNRIVVDLTPVRPGGENGGAKLLALELVKRFSRETAPHAEFILLTSSDSHDELAWLDRENVRRMCVNQAGPAAPAVAASPAPIARRSFARKITHFIGRILEDMLPKDLYRRVYRRFYQRVSQPQNNNLMRSLGANLVFCPFTGINYHSPEIPTIVVVHDLQYLIYPEFFSTEQLYHNDRNFRQVCKMADHIICVSEFTRESVLKFGEIVPERVTTIHTSLYNPIFPQPREHMEQVTSELKLSPGQYLFYPANFWAHKNHAMLLTAFNLYQHRHPNSQLKLVFTGAPGNAMENLRKAAQRMGLGEKVVFGGFLKEQAFAGLLQGCLALIFPSLFEGFGVPVLEAMKFGKPVLCSRLTSLPEVCGDAALYFDARRPDSILEAIEQIVADPALAETLVQRGKQQAARFDNLELWAQQYFQTFVEVFQGERVYQDCLSGVYGDHWAGSNLEITVAGGLPRQLEIEFAPQPWLSKDLTVQLSGSILGSQLTYTVKRGEKLALAIPLSDRGGIIEIHLSPAISPAELNLSTDTRPLSCMINFCRLVRENDSTDLLNGGSQ